MDYIELDLDSAVATQSAFKENSSTDTPVYELGRDLQNVVGFKIIETNIPSSYYLIDDQTKGPWGYVGGRVSAQWGAGGGFVQPQLLTTIPANRAWTGATLAAYLQADWQNQISEYPEASVSVVFNETTGKMTITAGLDTPNDTPTTVPFTFFDTMTAQMFGFLPANYYYNQLVPPNISFNSTSNQTWTWTSPYVALPTGPNYLQVNSLKLCNLINNYVPEGPLGTVGQTNTAICQVPVTTNFNGVNFWQNTQQDTFDPQNLFILDRFDLYLTLGTSKIPLKLNGLSWQCKIRIFIDRNYTSTSLQGNVEQNRIIKRIRPT